jgi:hypothetical protein
MTTAGGQASCDGKAAAGWRQQNSKQVEDGKAAKQADESKRPS